MSICLLERSTNQNKETHRDGCCKISFWVFVGSIYGSESKCSHLVFLFLSTKMIPKTIFGTIYNCKFILSDRQKCHLQSSQSNAYRRFHPALITFLGLTNLILIYIGPWFICYIKYYINYIIKYINPNRWF